MLDRSIVPTTPRALRRALALAAALTALSAPAAFAQGSGPGGTLQDVRKAWAAAVLKEDGPAAAALTVFPFQYEGYQSPKTTSRASYLREVPHWASLKECLATEPMKPLKKRSRLGTHSFNCDGHGFFFAQRNGAWRLTGYENSNE